MKHGARSVLLEGAFVALVGVLFGFAANGISPRGLALSRNYFPGVVPGSVAAASATPPAQAGAGTNAVVPSPAEVLAARLKANNLQLVNSNEVARLFRDPRCAQELVVFVDARNDGHYREGHIPGAYQLDHYRAEDYIASVLPACQSAEQIVVYCTGGDCEDSEFTAITLAGIGIPRERLFVYGGGMTEWATNGLPVEVGGRGSGDVRPGKP